MALTLILGTHNGIDAAKRNHAYQTEAVSVLRNIRKENNYKVALLYLFRRASFVRHQARIAEQLHLSLYASK